MNAFVEEVKLGRQWWRLYVEHVEADYPFVRLHMAAPDLRPFRCGDDGRPEDRKIGRQSLTLSFRKKAGRAIRSNDAIGTLDADQFSELSCVIRGLLKGGRGHVPWRGVADAVIGFLGSVGLRKPT